MSQGLRFYCVFYKAPEHDGCRVVLEESSYGCKLYIQSRGWQFLKAEEISKARAIELGYYDVKPKLPS